MPTDAQLNGPEEQRVPEAPKAPEIAEPADPEKEAAVERIGGLHGERMDAAEATSAAAAAKAKTETSPEPETPAVPPTTPPATPAAKEETFMDKISDYFDAAKARGSNAFSAGLETLMFALTTGAAGGWGWVKETWDKLWGKKKEEPSENQEYTVDDETFAPEDPDRQKLLAAAEKQLQEVITKNPTWIDFAREAGKEHGVPVETILAIARFESGFKAEAKATASSAEGLGQFIKETWASFIAANLDFSEAKPGDPRAALHAIAWYAKRNALDCSIDLASENATGEVYLAHHEGAAGYKRMKAFQRGELTGDQVPAIPGSYKGKAFPKFGIEKVNTYADYVTVVTTMSSRVETVADHYAIQLEGMPQPNS